MLVLEVVMAWDACVEVRGKKYRSRKNQQMKKDVAQQHRWPRVGLQRQLRSYTLLSCRDPYSPELSLRTKMAILRSRMCTNDGTLTSPILRAVFLRRIFLALASYPQESHI